MIAEALQVSRSNLSLKGPQKRKHSSRKGDQELLDQIKEVAHKRPTYGYRRITVLLNETLRKMGYPSVNRKRVYRLMKRNNLLLQKPSLKPARSHTGKVETMHSNTR
jgi:putative transposase